MSAWLAFLGALSRPLTELFRYVSAGANDAETERQLAMNIVRAAKDAETRRAIELQESSTRG